MYVKESKKLQSYYIKPANINRLQELQVKRNNEKRPASLGDLVNEAMEKLFKAEKI